MANMRLTITITIDVPILATEAGARQEEIAYTQSNIEEVLEDELEPWVNDAEVGELNVRTTSCVVTDHVPD